LLQNCVIHPIKALSDNYIWVISHPEADNVIVVDPGESKPVVQFLEQHKLHLSSILITHHHWDHTNGVKDLKRQYNSIVYTPKHDAVAETDHQLTEQDRIQLKLSAHIKIEFDILSIPAHTQGHIAYYSAPVLFCGDTLFSSGCGRLFEGSAEQMLAALHKMAALPEDTLVYCAHEYTLNNLKFANLVEPGNRQIIKRMIKIKELRSQNKPSLPSTIGIEKACNPFLRCNEHEIIQNVSKYAKKTLSNELEVFTQLRLWKDRF